MVSAQAREEQVRYVMERGLSQRRACALMRMARSGLYYERKMPLKDAPVCIDPAVSAQVKLLKHMPRQGFSFSALGEGAGGYRSRSNPRSRDWRAAGSRTGSGARIAP